jgi:hypothetical protein
MKIYIAGKITGLNFDEVVREFARAEQELVRCGQTPVNPLREVDQAPGRQYQDCLRDALKVLLTCDAIYLLPNWKDSKGARLEKHIADELGTLIVTHGFQGKRGLLEPETEIVVCGTPAPIEIEPGWKGCVRPKGHSGHCTAQTPAMLREIVAAAEVRA